MLQYIGKKVLTGTLAIIVVLILNFTLIHMAPGDPIKILAGLDNPSQEVIIAMQEKYGLNEPLPVQFFTYIKNLGKGDMGTSIIYDLPVSQLIMERLGPSALLTLTSSILAVIIGTLLGLYAARHKDGVIDIIFSAIAYIFNAMPPFWLGIMAILIFASWLKILPTSGMVDLRNSSTGFKYYLDVLKHLILPAGTLAASQIPLYFRITKSSVLQVLNEDFITTLRATGMEENKIYNKYIFKNAILPTVTVFSVNLAYIVTGAALIETVFAWPGTGRLMLSAINQRDYPMLMGTYFILSVSVAVVMIMVDIIYAYVDPRIRYK